MDDVKENDKTNVSVSEESQDSKSAKASKSSKKKSAASSSESGQSTDLKGDTVKIVEKPSSESAPASTNNGEVSQPPAPATPEAAAAPATGPSAEQEQERQKAREQESELVALNGLLLVALAGGMFYVGTVVFAADSLLFFTGIFVYLIVAPPGTYAQGKSKMASFTKEVAIAFGLTFILFLILKALMPADADQSKFFTIILAVMGVKLVFYPYYNFKQDND